MILFDCNLHGCCYKLEAPLKGDIYIYMYRYIDLDINVEGCSFSLGVLFWGVPTVRAMLLRVHIHITPRCPLGPSV